jgi:hypothetical protein
VGALPKILHELKVRGYRIVHVVPATPERPATPTDPEQWLTHRPSLEVAFSRWPKLPNFIYDETEALPAPALSEFEAPDGSILSTDEPFERARHGRGGQAPWPHVASVEPAASTLAVLPAPSESLFALPEKQRAEIEPFPIHPHHFDQPAVTAEGEAKSGEAASPAPTARITRGPRGRIRVTHGVREARHAAARSEKSTAKRQAHAEKAAPKRTRVASLKKHVR